MRVDWVCVWCVQVPVPVQQEPSADDINGPHMLNFLSGLTWVWPSAGSPDPCVWKMSGVDMAKRESHTGDSLQNNRRWEMQYLRWTCLCANKRRVNTQHRCRCWLPCPKCRCIWAIICISKRQVSKFGCVNKYTRPRMCSSIVGSRKFRIHIHIITCWGVIALPPVAADRQSSCGNKQ